jgi:hypothetical protein
MAHALRARERASALANLLKNRRNRTRGATRREITTPLLSATRDSDR